jgi:pilus assembly protein TadC
VFLILKLLEVKKKNEILFRLPLFLESIILLVESGLGVMPAVNEVVNLESKHPKRNPVTKVMRVVYELSAGGVPFSQALEQVSKITDCKPLRHVLLHLDVSSSEGGALIPSLRSLSDYAHREWRLAVEARVKRLENLVVFPVFLSVIGLMILTIAVPIVPVVEFFGTIEQKKVGQMDKAHIVSNQRN